MTAIFNVSVRNLTLDVGVSLLDMSVLQVLNWRLFVVEQDCPAAELKS